MVCQTLDDANINAKDLDAIAYTSGPGLLGPLLMGSMFAKTLAWQLNINSIGIHHMEGHLLAPLLDNDIEPPFLCLLVSGGHTQIVMVEKLGVYKVIGNTVDDAVGECFDKVARMLGLPYPGGVHVENLAKKGKDGVHNFTRPLKHKPTLNYSFSGLKIQVRYLIENLEKEEGELNEQQKADIALAFEQAAIDSLLIKCKRAFKQTGITKLVVAGGVSANKYLRETLNKFCDEEKYQVYFPRQSLCSDNGVMIAYAGILRINSNQYDTSLSVNVNPRWSLESLAEIDECKTTPVSNHK
jgi:N6-L-threonylcarbamoyladenine synthase